MEGICTNCGKLKKLVYDQWGDEWVCKECMRGENDGMDFPETEKELPEDAFLKHANRSRR